MLVGVDGILKDHARVEQQQQRAKGKRQKVTGNPKVPLERENFLLKEQHTRNKRRNKSKENEENVNISSDLHSMFRTSRDNATRHQQDILFLSSHHCCSIFVKRHKQSISSESNFKNSSFIRDWGERIRLREIPMETICTSFQHHHGDLSKSSRVLAWLSIRVEFLLMKIYHRFEYAGLKRQDGENLKAHLMLSCENNSSSDRLCLFWTFSNLASLFNCFETITVLTFSCQSTGKPLDY